MSAPLRSGSVLHCISVALSHVLAQDSQVVIAEIIGVSPSTISRRGDDLNQWPFPDLMRLALHRHELLEAMERDDIFRLIRFCRENHPTARYFGQCVDSGLSEAYKGILIEERRKKEDPGDLKEAV